MYKPHVAFYNRHGKVLRTVDYASRQYAMPAITEHMNAHPSNIVKIGERLCFTIHQADKFMAQQSADAIVTQPTL